MFPAAVRERQLVQRFYFDLTDGVEHLSDGEGVEAVSLDETLEAAHAIIAEMRAKQELPDQGEGWQLHIRDEQGAVVMRLPVA